MNCLKQLVVVSVVHPNPDQYCAWNFNRLPQDWLDLVWRIDLSEWHVQG
jgi:hypothetical protein